MVNKTIEIKLNPYGRTLEDFITNLRTEVDAMLPVEYANNVTSVRVDTASYEYSETEYGKIIVTYTRPETHEERNQRETQEAAYKEQRRRAYEQMKKEFEHGNKT